MLDQKDRPNEDIPSTAIFLYFFRLNLFSPISEAIFLKSVNESQSLQINSIRFNQSFKKKKKSSFEWIVFDSYLFWKICATKARLRFGEPSTMSFGVRYRLQPILSACSRISLALSKGDFTDFIAGLVCSGARTFNKQAYASPSCNERKLWEKMLALHWYYI